MKKNIVTMLKKVYKFGLISVVATVVCAGCSLYDLDGEKSDGEYQDIPLTRTQMEYAKTGNNAFALNLFKEVAEDQDIVISPLSATFALGMIDNGATGNTRDQIDKALGYEDSSLDGLNSFCGSMTKNANKVDSLANVEFANAIVVNNRKGKLLDDYTRAVEKNYQAELFKLDFIKDDVAGNINIWCGKHTHGKISQMMTSQPSPDSYLYALNVLYFKAPWRSKFRHAQTEHFTDNDGKQVDVKMMSQIETFKYASISGCCTAVSLPFGNQAYNMLFILPEDGKTLQDLKKSLDLKMWNKIDKSFKEYKVDVKIPSFAITYDSSLKNTLQKLGIVDAFNPSAAEFRLMTKEEAPWVSDVRQKARIIIDENGAEASAVTIVEMGLSISNGPQQAEKTFHADRPFIYAITEVSTGAIFFIGQYTGK